MFQESNAFSGFSVDDLEKARAFYADTLGLDVTVLDESMGLLQLDLAGRRSGAGLRQGRSPRAGVVHDPQLPGGRRRGGGDALAAKGVEFERYDGFDQDDQGIARGPGPLIAWFKDPAGNILSVLEDQ